MTARMTRRAVLLGALALAACSRKDEEITIPAGVSGASPQMIALVDSYADEYGVPRRLFHRVVQRESRYRPAARNGDFYGLMQIRPETARTMGFRGNAGQLLDAETNLKYAGRYLRGAYMVAKRNEDQAVRWYAQGYYYEAKRMGLLEETGLKGGLWRNG